MDPIMRLAKAWLFILMFLAFMMFPGLLVQTNWCLPDRESADPNSPAGPQTATVLTPPTARVQPTETTVEPDEAAVELEHFPEQATRPTETETPPPAVIDQAPPEAATADEPTVAENAMPTEQAVSSTNPSATQPDALPNEPQPTEAEPGPEAAAQPSSETAIAPSAGSLLNIQVAPDDLLEAAQTDAYQRIRLTLPSGAVVSAPFAGDVVKTYLAPGTGYTLYLVSRERGLALMIGGLRKEDLIAAGKQVPANARLGLTAVSDASEHLLYLQVRKLENADQWWQGPLQDPAPYCRAWLQTP